MSGGHFDYVQYKFDDPINELKAIIILNHKTREEAWKMFFNAESGSGKNAVVLYEILYSVKRYIDYWQIYPLSGYVPEVWDDNKKYFRSATPKEILEHNCETVFDFDDDTIAIFKKTIEHMKNASVYLNRVDWYLSGDDGEDDLKQRLKEDLEAEDEKQKQFETLV